MKRYLLIGGSGFVGIHMKSFLATKGLVFSIGSEVDVRDYGALENCIASISPDVVIHLAAISSIQESLVDPNKTYHVNFLGTSNVLEALKKNKFKGKMLFVSSSEIYGLVDHLSLPINESLLPKPLSPYAVSKLCGEILCYQLSQSVNFEIVIARPFNHIGPNQSKRFAIADFAFQISSIKLGLRPPVIDVGDVDNIRDFTDVRDVVSAYFQLAEFGINGEVYNVCSGQGYSVRSLINIMSELSGVDLQLNSTKDRMRSGKPLCIYGDNAKIHSTTGWVPIISAKQTLSDILAASIKEIGFK